MSEHDRDPADGAPRDAAPDDGAAHAAAYPDQSEHPEHPEHDDSPLPLSSAPDLGGRRRKKRSRLPGCLAVLVALAVLVGGGYLVYDRASSFIADQFSDPEDFEGPGSGRVQFEVASGDSSTQICRNLKDEGVVASVDACVGAATDNPDSAAIQAGFYRLKEEMSSADAIDVLVDPANVITDSVTIPEGLRVVDIVAILAEQTKVTTAELEAVLDDRRLLADLGLPDYAEGNPEGYLFPSTYAFAPREDAEGMVQAMLTRWRQAADDADLEASAERLGISPQELMTIASLVEAEGRGDDMPKVARVIYNRLSPDNDETAGLLQIDATVNYALGESGIARLTTDEIASVADSPYNTYEQPGLPPTPIEAPGDAAIAAAAAPAEGDWLYYVTVDLRTGETKFADTYDEFLVYEAEFDEYCATQSDRC